MSLSFDEFRAVSKRNVKEGDEVSDDGDDHDGDIPILEGRTAGDERKTFKAKKEGKAPFTLGDFLEMHELQALTLFFLLLDSFAAFTELSVRNNTTDDPRVQWFGLVVKIMHSLSTFFVYFFAFEVFSLVVAFRLRVFGHLGYIVDVGVIGMQVWAVSVGTFSVECHLLNIFRMWRLVRLFNSMVYMEVEAHGEARRSLAAVLSKQEALEEGAARGSAALLQEQEARRSVESLLQDYKDEVDTLNEALKIAAMDIAEVAQAEEEFFLSDEEGDELSESARGHSLDHDEGSQLSFVSESVDTAQSGGAASALHKKETLYREALKEERGGGQVAGRGQRATLVINENGSFQQS